LYPFHLLTFFSHSLPSQISYSESYDSTEKFSTFLHYQTDRTGTGLGLSYALETVPEKYHEIIVQAIAIRKGNNKLFQGSVSKLDREFVTY